MAKKTLPVDPEEAEFARHNPNNPEKLPDGQITQKSVQPFREKYSA